MVNKSVIQQCTHSVFITKESEIQMIAMTLQFYFFPFYIYVYTLYVEEPLTLYTPDNHILNSMATKIHQLSSQ